MTIYLETKTQKETLCRRLSAYRGGNSINFGEGTTEIIGIGIANFIGNFVDGIIGLNQ